jgi:hypothetical protein
VTLALAGGLAAREAAIVRPQLAALYENGYIDDEGGPTGRS